jgi:hypothetical protein
MDIEYSTNYAAWESVQPHNSGTRTQHDVTSGVVVDAIDLSYSVLVNEQYKRILRDVNIHIEAVS